MTTRHAPRLRLRAGVHDATTRQNAAVIAIALALAAGGALQLAGVPAGAAIAWGGATVATFAVSLWSVAAELRHRRAGVDIVAALALAGSIVVQEYLAGAVIAFMLATGHALEVRASARARRELKALLAREPVSVHRIAEGGVATVPINAVRVDDMLLVVPGEVVPVDGVVVTAGAVLDESTLTGEAALVERPVGDSVLSGAVNSGAAFRMRATALAADSTYAGIVRLVRDAEASRAPLTRMADRFALLFVPLTLMIAGGAAWVGHDLVRAVAVLVVATPCPLILAAPVAIIGGMSRAARRGIVIKNGAALDALGRARVVLLDKTGTLTEGRAQLSEIESAGAVDGDTILELAASVDQASTHALARPIADAARARALTLAVPEDVEEDPGRGIAGVVHGRRVTVGRGAYVAAGHPIPPWAAALRERTARAGLAIVFVGVDGEFAGALVLEDRLRPDARDAIRRLHEAGATRVCMVTGDHRGVADTAAQSLGIDSVYAECSPAEKLQVLQRERAHGVTVMVGDGINDAPALAAADVGIAIGARGATVSSETADVVLMVDRIDRIAEAMAIARHSRRIAMQSIVAGMALAGIAMVVAAAGWLAPVAGAVLQEGIDLAAIANALRAHGAGRAVVPRVRREELPAAAPIPT